MAAAGLPLAPGLLVDQVHPGGPAEAGGLRRGDLLISLGAHEVRYLADLADAISGHTGAVTLTVQRGDQTSHVTIHA